MKSTIDGRMTPEERAKQAMFGSNAPFMDDEILTDEHPYAITYPQLVATIRDAVEAEREASNDMAKALVAYLAVTDDLCLPDGPVEKQARAALAKARGLA